MKLKICELATRNKFTEEWTFLSENLKSHFRAAGFKFLGVLLLNLVSRKQLLVERERILNQMKAKASVAEAHIGNRSIICSKIGQMTTAINKIVVPCSFLMNWGDAELGGLKYS